MGLVTQRVLDDAGFSIPNGIFLDHYISIRALVVLELLVSLMSLFGAFSARISRDRHTD